MIACAIICLQLVDHFGHAIFDQHVNQLGSLANKSLKVLIYDKSFRMGSTGKRNFTFAQVLSIVSNESTKIWQGLVTISDIIITPFEIAYCAFFIYIYVGWSILSGLALWLIRFVIMRYIGHDKMEFQQKMNELKDTRL